MADAGVERYRDLLRKLVPWWLSDRRRQSGRWVGYRYLWAICASVDVHIEAALQALRAPWPGIGTPTALSLTGRSRGILRGESDTDAQYAVKLNKWFDKWRGAGSQRQLAIELHEYLGNAPRVRVINRAGHWVTCNADGTITTNDATWNWDGTSNPERAGFWSELFVVVYPTAWANTGTWGAGRLWGARDSGLGHQVTRTPYDAVRAILAQWKGAHTSIRCVIFTSAATLFNPLDAATCPNGTWGEYGTTGASRTSSRNTTTCRFWEP